MGEAGTAGAHRPHLHGEQVCGPPDTGFGVKDDFEEEREQAVAAAVEVVAASARRGVVALCATVAHIIRKNFRLQQHIAELETRLLELEALSGLPKNTGAICQSSARSREPCSASPGISGANLDINIVSPSISGANPSISCANPHISIANPDISIVSPDISIANPDTSIANPETSIASQSNIAKETSSAKESSIANNQSHSISTSLPESPTAVRCGSAPPHYPPGYPSGPRKGSDPEGAVAFLRGHTRASTGNLSHYSAMTAFVRQKYCSISLRRVRRTPVTAVNPFVGRRGTATGDSQGSSTASLEQQYPHSSNNSNSSSSSKSCIITVAEVYPSPDTTITTTNATTTAATNTTTATATSTAEGETVKLLAQKLTSVLQEEISSSQQDTDSLVLCAPHPLAGCMCAVCMQLATHVHTYEIVTEEGSLLPPGSRVLVRGQRVGQVLYFGHRRHPITPPQHLPSTPQHHLPLLSTPGSCDPPPDSQLGGVASPIGVTLVLWPPDEGEVFVPLNEVICQLDGDESSIEGGDDWRCAGDDATPITTHTDPTTLTDIDRSTESSLLHTDSREKIHKHQRLRSVSASFPDQPTARHRAPSRLNSTDNSIQKQTELTHASLPASPQNNRQLRTSKTDTEAPYTDSGKGKLQFSDTWDSGIYMSVGRQNSECSEHFSDLDSEYSCTPWASSVEDALDTVWHRHKQSNTLNVPNSQQTRGKATDSYVTARGVKVEYRTHKKARDDYVG